MAGFVWIIFFPMSYLWNSHCRTTFLSFMPLSVAHCFSLERPSGWCSVNSTAKSRYSSLHTPFHWATFLRMTHFPGSHIIAIKETTALLLGFFNHTGKEVRARLFHTWQYLMCRAILHRDLHWRSQMEDCFYGRLSTLCSGMYIQNMNVVHIVGLAHSVLIRTTPKGKASKFILRKKSMGLPLKFLFDWVKRLGKT